MLASRDARARSCTYQPSPSHFTAPRWQADVDLIAREMEMDKEAAELALREHKGDVVAALNTLVAA